MAISIDNRPVADMMKVINPEFIINHDRNIRIEPSKYSITIKYIRDDECPIRDVYFVFNGDESVHITGLNLSGNMISGLKFDLNHFDIERTFRQMVRENFGINMEF